MKPRIAIPVPHSTDLEYSQRSWPTYATAVEQAGGEAVKIPLDLTPREVADLINTRKAAVSLTCPKPIYGGDCQRHPAVRFDGHGTPLLKTGNLGALEQTTRWQQLFARSDALGKPSAVRAFMRMGE